jgi:uroporphyrinogen-III synthase
VLVLVTRPWEQAGATTEALAAVGHEALVDPVLRVEPLPLPELAPEGVAAVVVTSANAARRLPARLRGLPVLAVGAATAAAAREAGAADVRAGEGDGRALAGLVGRTLGPGAGTILHLAGTEVRPGLEAALRAAGYAYRRVAAYEAVPCRDLGEATRAALEEGRLDAALFFSPRTAAVWRSLVEAAGLEGKLKHLVAACLSEAAAAELTGLPLAEVRIAARPEQAALLRCLDGPASCW